MFCPKCSGPVDPSDRYCRMCGTMRAHHPSGAENRLVTVLCTDLSGYSQLAERLDPEDLRDCMSLLMEEITRIIVQYGGAVEKYIGDAVLAIFGAYRTRENDTTRAVLAARQIHRAVEGIDLSRMMPAPFQLRMHTGINTGEVVVEYGSSVASPHGMLGKPINVASRLCDLAADGEILIGETLASDVVRQFLLEWKGTRLLKGAAAPIHVYRVLDEKENPTAVHRDGGATSPMVGREQELSILASRSRDLVSGRGGVIRINGDAGIGKSRLIKEFLDQLGIDVPVLVAACYDHARTVPYYPFFRLVPLAMGLGGLHGDMHDNPHAAQDGGEHRDHIRHLEFFVHGHTERDSGFRGVLREKISDAVFWLFTTVSSKRPVIVCIEDIHWADQSSLDLVSYLMDTWERNIPCLVVLSHRPGWSPGFGSPEIRLRELTGQEVGRMLSLMLGAPSVPEDLVASMTQASGGNPFFLEEMVNYFMEKGSGMPKCPRECMGKGVPASLHGLIASRIDNLDACPRRIIQEASLIGRIFSRDLLRSVSSVAGDLDAGLKALIDHGFIHAEGTREYAFRHDIMRDVAGRSLLKRERTSIHRKIALVLEESAASATGNTSDVLAHHYSMAQEYKKALHYHMEAARQCQGSGAWIEAASQYTAAEQVLETRPGIVQGQERIRDVREGIWSCTRVFDPVLATSALEALTCQYRKTGQIMEEAFSFIRLINLYSQRGLFAKAFQAYEYGLSLCNGDPVLVAAAQTAIAYTYTFLGQPTVALGLLDASRPILESSDRFLHAFNTLSTLAASVWVADMGAAGGWYDRTKELSREYMDIDLMADIWLAHIYCLQGRFVKGRMVHDEVVAREKKLGRQAGGLSYLRIQGSIYFRSRYFGDLQGARSDLALFDVLSTSIEGASSLRSLYAAWIALEEGRAREAHDLAEAALPGLREGIANRVPYALNVVSEARISLGDPTGASRAALECIEWTGCSGNGDQCIWALRTLALACILEGKAEAAHRAAVRACRLACRLGLKPHLAWIVALYGDVCRMRGRIRSARRCYVDARRRWVEMGNRYQADKVSARQRLLLEK